jgi:hypothetical protein
MTIKIRDLRDVATTGAPLAPLRGGALAKRDRVLAVHGEADRLLGNGRRVVCRVGLHGAENFQVGNADPDSDLTQVYPDHDTPRVAARAKWKLTPGTFPMLSALVVPSGMTQRFSLADPIGWVADEPHGRLQVLVSFNGIDDVTRTLDLPISLNTWGAESTAEGAAWAALRRVEIPLVYPEQAHELAADVAAWSEGVECELELRYIGGCRVVDAVVQERPWRYGRDVGTDDAPFASTLVVDAAGDTVGAYPAEYPVEERNADDPTYGMIHLLGVAHRQHTELGPVLAAWPAWDETTQPVTATDAATVSTSSTSFVRLLDAGAAYDAAAPGWSVSSGGQAQQWRSSNAARVLRDKDACVPVRVWAYCHRTGSGTATVRFQSADYSVADVAFASSTPAWRSGVGHLRCGLGPEDASVLQVLGRVTVGTAALHVRHVLVEYLDA